MAVTIHDVARAAGVSVKTVSRAMNDHPDVSATTREVVRETARTLGYRPNPAARGLRTGSTGMIALLVPDILNPHFAELARHLQAFARAEGRVSVLSSYDSNPELATAVVRSFIDHRVDGLVWMTETIPAAAWDALVAAELPAVISGGFVPEGVDHIRSVRGHTYDAYERATYAAAEYLIGLGHQELAYVAESPHLASVQARISGFRQALADHALPTGAGLIWNQARPELHTSELGYQAVHELLADGHRPTAICASSDTVATGVLRALHERKLAVPADVSVVGHDGTWQAAYASPPMTTLQTPYEAWCKTALALLRHLIEPVGPEPASEAGFTLVVRESTGPAPTRGGRARHLTKGGGAP
ncbi:MAG TPA: LacI family DNA-binding transcriptional regulator [Gemmatimonadales bacterium]|nr:LacI family DNA-binding transcriptional regulator [Gemmatimonadales bacterium]